MTRIRSLTMISILTKQKMIIKHKKQQQNRKKKERNSKATNAEIVTIYFLKAGRNISSMVMNGKKKFSIFKKKKK